MTVTLRLDNKEHILKCVQFRKGFPTLSSCLRREDEVVHVVKLYSIEEDQHAANLELKLLLEELKDAFPETLPSYDTLKCKPIKHKIELINQGPLPKQPIYRMTVEQEETLKENLKELLEAGFIRESTSSIGAPIIFVKKKDGALRMCRLSLSTLSR